MTRSVAAPIARIPNQIVRVLRYVGAADRGNRMSRLPHSARALGTILDIRCAPVDEASRSVGETFLADLFVALPRSRATVHFAERRLRAAWGEISAHAGDAEVARRLVDARETIALLATYIATGMAVEVEEAREVLETQRVVWSRRSFFSELEQLAERRRLSPARPLTTVGRVSLPRVLRGSAPAHDGWLELTKTLEAAAQNEGKALAETLPPPEHLRVACVYSPRLFELLFELRDTSSDAIGAAVRELSAPSEMLEAGERRAFRTLCHYLELAAGSGPLRRRGILYRLHLEAGLSASHQALARLARRELGDVLLALDNAHGLRGAAGASR
jgi:hypothetical protein